MVNWTDADRERLRAAYEAARSALLAERQPEGCWVGALASSALSTATAVGALALVSQARGQAPFLKGPVPLSPLIAGGVRWLESHQNGDGGWGDTPDSPSNVPTTLLAAAALCLGQPDLGPALSLAEGAEASVLARAARYLHWHAGDAPEARVATVRALYGADRTFAVPILMTCALAAEQGSPAASAPSARLRAGLVGVDWASVPRLPFELAWLPRAAFRWLRLHVVSYALPALIAIGQLLHARRPTRNLLRRWLRDWLLQPTLRRLDAIQPSSGGFLEAVPLTSFVLMGLAGAGRTDHAVVRRGVEFLQRTARADGSWPIDSNLSTWVTTLAVNALSAGGRSVPDADAAARGLLERQHLVRHPFTDSPPGGWGWTPLPGGVPDADDTAGALLALAKLEGDREGLLQVRQGLRWLLRLQNRNGGWPTFCRGWGRLPFDRSAPDLTAHALRAIKAWLPRVGQGVGRRALRRGLAYLRRAQRPDGGWVPLWFGNQEAPRHENPVYGTARVLLAYRDLGNPERPEARRGVEFLLGAQNADGGWGGNRGVVSSVEETALALEALAAWREEARVAEACLRGARALAERVAAGDLARPAPIGLYFARLWYSERLYPIIFTVGALGCLLPADGTSETR